MGPVIAGQVIVGQLIDHMIKGSLLIKTLKDRRTLDEHLRDSLITD